MHLQARLPVQPLRRIRALAAPEHDPPRRIQSDAVKEVSTVREALTEVDKARGSSKRASKNDASSRRSSSIHKGGSKGFGTSSKQAGALPTKAAPVDAAEASRGAIDYVQVASWGSGQPEQLGDLQVQRLERRLRPAPPPAPHANNGSSGAGMGVPGQTGLSEGVVGAGAGEGGRRRGDAGAGGRGPLYDLLGREVASAEARGALAVAGPPPPPLQAWSFTPARYTQYLADCLAVHSALDTALQAAAAAGPLLPTHDAPPWPQPLTSPTQGPPEPPADGPGGSSTSRHRDSSQPPPVMNSNRQGGAASGVQEAEGTAPSTTQERLGQGPLSPSEPPAPAPPAAAAAAAAAVAISAAAGNLVQSLAYLQAAGLHRSAALTHDLQLLQASWQDQAGGSSEGGESCSSGSSSSESGMTRDSSSPAASLPLLAPVPSAHATSLAQQLHRWGRDLRTAAAQLQPHHPAAPLPSSSSSAVQAELSEMCEAAGLRLLAHTYALHVTHLAGGMRFGAVAAEKLGLAQAGATHFYSVYPAHVQDPVAALRQALNEAGTALLSSQVEALLQELPGAVRSASLLMTALAHRD